MTDELQPHPNFYANIPATVRYDKSLSLLARILYAEITALANKEGYCWATNKYFAELYQVEKETISRAVNSLLRREYIKVEIVDNNKRKIYLLDAMTKKSWGYHKKVIPPLPWFYLVEKC